MVMVIAPSATIGSFFLFLLKNAIFKKTFQLSYYISLGMRIQITCSVHLEKYQPGDLATAHTHLGSLQTDRVVHTSNGNSYHPKADNPRQNIC